MRTVGTITTTFYVVFAAFVFYVLPVNKYEWMLDDPVSGQEGLTFCTLPLYDSMTRPLTFMMILPIIIAAIVWSIRRRKIHYTAFAALALLAFWGWRFFVHYPLCPDGANS